MKEKFLTAVLVLALLVSVAGCSGEIWQQSPYQESDFDTSGGIVLRVEHPVYDKSVTSFHYYVENHTDAEVTFGAPYEIEVLRNGEWHSLPAAEDTAWNSIAYLVQPGEEWSNSFSFFPYDYEVKDGQYRLVKEIGGKRYAAEFTIGESEITAETPFGYDALEELPEVLDMSTLEFDLHINAAGEVVGGREEQITAFLEQVSLRADAALRIVCEGIGGEVVLYDIIYQNDHFLCRRDATRGSSAQVIEERRYAFLVTDGECVYLSDAVSLEEEELDGRSISAGRYTILQKSWFADWEAVTAKVESIKESLLTNSVVRARFWSEDGTYWLDLTGEPMDYLVSTKGYGMGRTLTECGDGSEVLEIVSVRWENETQVRLLCLPVDGEKVAEPGWYAVFDTGAEKVVSSGRSMWVSSFQSSGIHTN